MTIPHHNTSCRLFFDFQTPTPRSRPRSECTALLTSHRRPELHLRHRCLQSLPMRIHHLQIVPDPRLLLQRLPGSSCCGSGSSHARFRKLIEILGLPLLLPLLLRIVRCVGNSKWHENLRNQCDNVAGTRFEKAAGNVRGRVSDGGTTMMLERSDDGSARTAHRGGGDRAILMKE